MKLGREDLRMEPITRPRLAAAVGVVLTGCATLTQFDANMREPAYSFAPAVATTEVRFEVVDRRSSESKSFRVEEIEGVATYVYGDGHFFPTRMRALATQLAKAFPMVTQNATLAVDRFDVSHRVTRGAAPTNLSCSFGYDCVASLLIVGIDKANPARNLIACRLAGRLGDIAFDVSFDSSYADYDRTKQAARVGYVLQGAIDAAVTEIRNELRARKQIAPDIRDVPPLPAPWLPRRASP